MTASTSSIANTVQSSVLCRIEVAAALGKAARAHPKNRAVLLQVAQTWKGLADIAFAEETALQRLVNR